MQVTVVASADLKGLGAREGLPVSHVWHPPPPPPPPIVVAASRVQELPVALLFLLPLFLLKANRCGAAWAIWLPLAVTIVATVTGVVLLANGDRNLLHSICAAAIGLTALWLLSPYLKSRHRFLTFLKTFPVLTGFALLAFLPRLLGESEGWFDIRGFLAIGVGVLCLSFTVALVMAGLSVRRQFGRLRFLVWLAVWLLVAWIVILTPFCVWALTQGEDDWIQYTVAALSTAGIGYAVLLPFVLMSFLHAFYRDRFLAFLNARLDDPAPSAGPPPLSPTAP